MKILADTSAWIQWLRGVAPPKEETLLRLVTCGPIAQEVLQGLKPGEEAKQFAEFFLNLPFIDDPIPSSSFVEAARLYAAARRKGITVRSSVDCLIATIAIKHDCTVIHRDRDYDQLARVSSLKVIRL